jgi:hypothetical protein
MSKRSSIYMSLDVYYKWESAIITYVKNRCENLKDGLCDIFNYDDVRVLYIAPDLGYVMYTPEFGQYLLVDLDDIVSMVVGLAKYDLRNALPTGADVEIRASRVLNIGKGE